MLKAPTQRQEVIVDIPPPTDEDVAYIHEICDRMRAIFNAETEQWRKPIKRLRPSYVIEGDAALAAIQDQMGIKAKPAANRTVDHSVALRKMTRE